MRDQETDRQKTLVKVSLVFLIACTIGLGVVIYKGVNKMEDLKSKHQTEYIELKQQYASEFKDIEENLNEILAHENLIERTIASNEELSEQEIKDRINKELLLIDQLIRENQLLIDDLNKELGEKSVEIAEYNKEISGLNKRVNRYKKEIDNLNVANNDLKAELETFAFNNETLQRAIENKERELSAKIEQLEQSSQLLEEQRAVLDDLKLTTRSAYYTVGTYRELKDANVVEKTGGVLGIGASKQIKSDFNKDYFSRINKFDYTTIPVYSKRAELVSNHDPSSYEWVENDNEIQYLRIKDPVKFWEQGKFLVIVAKDRTFELASNK